MAKKYWKQFIIYQRVILIFFAISLIFDIINKDFLDTWAPQEIIDYMFWLSLGLYIGFLLCRYEIKKIWENIEKDKQEKKPDRNDLYN